MNLKTKAVVVLSFDNRKRFADFFMVLMVVDRRINGKRPRKKKSQKTKSNYKKVGSHIRGPGFLMQLYYS